MNPDKLKRYGVTEHDYKVMRRDSVIHALLTAVLLYLLANAFLYLSTDHYYEEMCMDKKLRPTASECAALATEQALEALIATFTWGTTL